MGKINRDIEHKKSISLNRELAKQNKELVDAVNYMKQRDEAQQRLLFLLLERTGPLKVMHSELASVGGSILGITHEDGLSTTYFIKEKEGDLP